MSRKYHVALSFAGEDRHYVDGVAQALKAAGVEFFSTNLRKSIFGEKIFIAT